MIEEITDILSLPPGSAIVYHRGNLAHDRVAHADAERRSSINEAGVIAWKLYEKGRVLLVQRRVEPDVMDYLAIRTTAP